MAGRIDPLDPQGVFHLGDIEGGPRISAIDFWRWGFSDLQENIVRGILAEFIVGSALGVDLRTRQSWDEFDLVTPSGITVEVKSSAYVQAWSQSKRSSASFNGLKTRIWRPTTGYEAEASYHSDIYVFCLQTASSDHDYDPLSLEQWEFRVVDRPTLKAHGTKSISYGRLCKLQPRQCGYLHLASEVERVHSASISIKEDGALLTPKQ
jgi:hypothetical protein